MVLAINSSTKAMIGFTSFAAVGLFVLFLRSRANGALQLAPSLNPERYAFLTKAPIISSVYYYFNPKKPTERPVFTIGDQHNRLSIEKLIDELDVALKEGQPIKALVMYGKNLNLIQDPGILALNPKKLILVGVQIDASFEENSLEQLMVNSGWSADEFGALNIIQADSVAKALQADAQIPTVYRVRESKSNVHSPNKT
jgi:hypothetical protein